MNTGLIPVRRLALFVGAVLGRLRTAGIPGITAAGASESGKLEDWHLFLFQMFQSCVENFFHALQFGSPEILDVIKPVIDIQNQDSGQHRVEEHRKADRKIQLSIGHHGHFIPVGIVRQMALA
jgi:hypothetical protein